MADRSLVVVGGGLAGLAAGCYARMNGYRVTVCEMHRIPGGLCTAWKRKGYTFDISMHMVMGSRSGPLHQMWQELGAMQRRSWHYPDVLLRVESGAKQLSYRADADDVADQMRRLSPGDEKRIQRFASLIGGRSMTDALLLRAAELQSPFDKARQLLSVLPHLPTLLAAGDQTLQDFAEGFSDPFLRRAVRGLVDTPGWPMVRFPLAALNGFLRTWGLEAGAPLGGSQAVAFDIADRFRSLGGELRLKTRVAELIVENDRAAGVVLADGEELRADTVIWAADGHHLIFELLGGRYMDDPIRTMYDRWIPTRPLVHVCLGVARDLSAEPGRITFELADPITVAGERRRWISVLHHGFDPTRAPAGKTALEVWYPCDYDYWEDLARRPESYQAEKALIAEQTIAKLNERWPGLAQDVEVVDVPTPVTYVRYTGNWQGSPDGWYITPDNLRADPLRRLPGLSDLLLAGQWTLPFAGTVMSALTGRQAVEVLCHRDGIPFRTTTPRG